MRDRRTNHRYAEGRGGGPLTYDREAHLRVLFERVSRADTADAWPLVVECLDEAIREPHRVVPVPGVLRVILHLMAAGDREHAGALYTRLKEWSAASSTSLDEYPRWRHVRETMDLEDAPRQIEVAAAALEDPARADRILHPPPPPPPPRPQPAPAPEPQTQMSCLVPIFAVAIVFLVVARAMLTGSSPAPPPYYMPPDIKLHWDAALLAPLEHYDMVVSMCQRVREEANGDREVIEAADLVERGARAGNCDDVKRGLERMPRADGGKLATTQELLDLFARGRCP